MAGSSAVFTCIRALGTPSRTGPLARKYLPGFPYYWSLRRLRQKISSIYCTVICNYPSAAQEQPFTAGLFCMLVFVRSCSSINNKIISLKKFILPQPVEGPTKRKKNPGALGTCPVCPLVKTALAGSTEWSHMAWVPVAVRLVANCFSSAFTCLLLLRISVRGKGLKRLAFSKARRHMILAPRTSDVRQMTPSWPGPWGRGTDWTGA